MRVSIDRQLRRLALGKPETVGTGQHRWAALVGFATIRAMTQAMSLRERIWLGIAQHPRRFLIAIPVSLAALWAPIEPLATTYTDLAKWPLLLALLVLAIAIATWRSVAPHQILLRLGATRLELSIGDVFSAAEHVAIPADDYFLVTHPKLVNARSLIGQLVQRKFQGSAARLERRIADVLKAMEGRHELTLPSYETPCPVGTTAVLREQASNIFVTAVCRVNLETSTGNATAEDVLIALNGLWTAISQNRTGQAVAVPLFGSGQSGCGLSVVALLHLHLVSLAAFVRVHPLPDTVRIVLHPAVGNEIDLRAVRDAWAGAN